MKYILFFPLLFADCISENFAHKTCVGQTQKKEVKAKSLAKTKPLVKAKSIDRQKPEISFTLFINM